jgi:hypothetical protein
VGENFPKQNYLKYRGKSVSNSRRNRKFQYILTGYDVENQMRAQTAVQALIVLDSQFGWTQSSKS